MVRFLGILLLGATSVCCANSRDEDRARLLRLVPLPMEALAHSAQNCQPPGVYFVRADFDGDRSFRYVVASYFVVCRSRITSAVRVLKEANGKLLLDQIPPALEFRPGQTLIPDLLDLENSGIPELLLHVWNGVDRSQQQSLLLLKWKDGMLQPISTANIDTKNAVFRDIYADGRLEMVSDPRCLTTKFVRKKRARGLPSNHGKGAADPKSCSGAAKYLYRSGEFREIEVRRSEAKLSRLAASDKEFSLAEIRQPLSTSQAQKEFVLQLGWSKSPSDSTSAVGIRPETLLLGRALRPLAVTTKLEKQDQGYNADHSHAVQCVQEGVLEAHFDRQSGARLLPRLQLTKSLESGDQVLIPLTALMEDGDYVSADITVSISK